MSETPSESDSPASSGEVPLLVYDGDCAFCNYTVEYARAVTGERVAYEPYQTAAVRHPNVAEADFARQIYLFGRDDTVTGAQAAFVALAVEPRLLGWLWLYSRLPGFAWIAEIGYRATSRHRSFVYAISRTLFGPTLAPLEYRRTASIVARAAGVLAASAFVSWWVQADGLIGDDGILPVARYFAALARDPDYGFFSLPSLYWLVPRFATTHTLTAIGLVGALGLTLNRFVAASAALVYVAYLSLFAGGQLFMDYQWDILLIEVAAALVVLGVRERLGVWVLRLLLFRFMLLSGAVKLLSGDPTWRGFTALFYHFESQPLPAPGAYFAHHLPPTVLEVGVAVTFAVELVLPFLLFAPRRIRIGAALATAVFQLAIIATGNYTFFNMLTIVLCCAAGDDRFFGGAAFPPRETGRAHFSAGVALAAFALLGALHLRETLQGARLTGVERALIALTDPWHVVNDYGLFAVMTTRRDELVVEGSLDGVEWQPYVFRYEPQALDRALEWVVPHQPRLDWQMWFASLEPHEGVPWIDSLIYALLTAKAPVLDLFAHDPFAGKPPTWIRILSYRYRFTAPGSADVWTREAPELWYPPVRLARSEDR